MWFRTSVLSFGISGCQATTPRLPPPSSILPPPSSLLPPPANRQPRSLPDLAMQVKLHLIVFFAVVPVRVSWNDASLHVPKTSVELLSRVTSSGAKQQQRTSV